MTMMLEEQECIDDVSKRLREELDRWRKVIELARAEGFRAGARATIEPCCRAICEFCAMGDIATLESDGDGTSAWVHRRPFGATWCDAGVIRALPIPEPPPPGGTVAAPEETQP